ncbi:rab-GTPase-TBC domain-containing protein [Spinellus fusiger]|nr:rab-GTPase-TBC domain-containing protein [Spinellus fusiger]
MTLLTKHHSNEQEAERDLLRLRHAIYTIQCPDKLRARVWKLLLHLVNVSSSCYISLVHRGPSLFDNKIRNDTFRTMTTDALFLERVSEDMLIRVLNAFVWISRQGSPGERTSDTSEEIQLRQKFRSLSSCANELSYVQGMNVLAAPFLMVMPEMEAFFSFSTFLWQCCPLYVQPTLKGVHCGLKVSCCVISLDLMTNTTHGYCNDFKLVDLCMNALDPTLYGFLLGKGLTANVYAFASVLTFSACTPPLSELLKLWDLMFAFGFHLNILYIIAQVAIVRRELLLCPSPMKILRKLPPLNAQPIISIAMVFCRTLPPSLYDKLVRHAYDESVADELGVQVVADPHQPQDDVSDTPAYMTEAMNRFHNVSLSGSSKGF